MIGNGSQKDAIEIMKMMESVTVNADLIAQALGMNPGVLRKHVRDGDYHFSKYEICGDRIRFFRKDFLQAIGEMAPDPEEKTADQMILEQLVALNEGVTMLCQMVTLMMEPHQLDALNELLEKKTAGAATPTE